MTSPALPDGLRVFERGWLSSNNVLFLGDEPALVDSGYVSHSEQTLALVAHALPHGQPLARLINTHLHSDHCGGNAALQARYGCRTWVPAAEAESVRHWDAQRLSFDATGQQCARFTFDETLSPGDTMTLGEHEWLVLGAPGHDPHALMLYNAADGILISGDALWERGFGVIFPELDGESGFAEQAAVLDLIEQLDVAQVIPGHGQPFGDIDGALAAARSRLDYLRGDPARNARNALKVLIVFRLMAEGDMPRATLKATLDTARAWRGAAAMLAPPSAWPRLLDTLVDELARAGALRVDADAGMLHAV
ncbi:MBL fold metallo-hydrolase [Pandoraea nosoerga]|uniref:beta-lactamase n=1 Tax=Pandoraea nosoerga TaxID=2508296 RepID=A0A5E4S1L8_9BURK|nr:MBL fold metallo-hydrolase [Pandoraea nosoerga]MBN4667665.1 MBL fold metallo-hydrolase [Pandoraea nosoerga]MBN4674256.1 MBL fold metallo-hydrolase [Pandoraea nosoerga]MBN4679525.1 MBL fold metallo-hydrolase [Pandoraea nosoerga]MBN4743386.1 MBL fold metallo-hydrolase [Pandoraea nosoerga]VVD68008.1 MBL fold metallo-hydrolase [Pandoraea nosoerga]